jgi:phosphatidylserine synthase
MISIFGAVVVFVLLDQELYIYLPLIVAINLLADDLDGMVARRLGTSGEFGRYLDLVCDAASHAFLLMIVAANHGVLSAILAPVILMSMFYRLSKSASQTIGKNNGTTTNEFIVSLQLVVAVELSLGVDLEYLLATLACFSILTLNSRVRVKTLRRVMSDKMLLVFDGFLILGAFVPKIALILLAMHVIPFLVGTLHVISVKVANQQKI